MALVLTAATMSVTPSFVPALAPTAVAGPDLRSAQQQATQLRAQVDRLDVQVEQAAEAYDAAQEQLGAAVTDYLTAEQQVSAAHESSTARQSILDSRAVALYESGGQAGMYAAALGGADLSDVLDRWQLAKSVITADSTALGAADATVASLDRTTTRLDRLAARRAALQSEAAARADGVRALLARQQSLLAAADSRVRTLVVQQQQQAQQQAARAFAARLAAARRQAATQLALPPTPAAGQVPRQVQVPPVGSQAPVGGDAAPDAVAAAAIAAARTRLGMPYVWGATGPGAFDCSGLTGWSYAQAGHALPRTAEQQWYAGAHVTLAQLAPGDLLFWASDLTDPASIHHVALYIGGSLMIAAPHTGTVVRVEQVYLSGYIGAVRPTA